MSANDPQLFFADDGTPRSARFGDIYYSPQDGLSESRAVFLQGCRLPEAWCNGGQFSVLELGFGTGLNVAALMQLWTDNRPAGGHLHIFSVEGFLMPADAAGAALSNWPELDVFRDALLAQWPKSRHGFHHMDFPQWGVSLTVALMDVREALSAWGGPADAVFLDGFSPALNPDMWSEDVFQRIAARSRPGARLATFTVAGFVRRGLQLAGFVVEKRPGFGRKRERLEAVLPDAPTIRPCPTRMAVIGAGIAGASLAYQASRLGIQVDVFEMQRVGAGASGNDAALVTPRLDAGDMVTAGLFADAHVYATGLYRREWPQSLIAEGVYHCESQPRDAMRFDRLADQPVFAEGALTRFGRASIEDLPDTCGLVMHDALTVEPERVLAGLLVHATVVADRVTRILPQASGAELLTASGGHHTYDVVVVACGDGVFDLETIAADHDLRPVRGQVETVQSKIRPPHGISWGGYLAPSRNGFLFGATHDREDRDATSRETDRQRNFESLKARLPHMAEALADQDIRSRASVRVTTRDHLPLAGELAPGLHALTGLGARGFCLAPLLARDIVAQIGGAPPCLPQAVRQRLASTRLQRTYSS
jgi:tRNA 5-methylaminomethyl-2-thiouridine biosynthesis bifunctional protein